MLMLDSCQWNPKDSKAVIKDIWEIKFELSEVMNIMIKMKVPYMLTIGNLKRMYGTSNIQSNLAIVNFLRSSKKFTIARSLLLKGFDQYSNMGIILILNLSWVLKIMLILHSSVNLLNHKNM